MSKQVQKVCNAISTAAVVLVVILALLLVGVRLVGLRPMCVLSGSMEPTYHTGSLIYVKPCAPEDVQVGDAITFVLNEDLDVVTHRVISIDAENEHFYTQGDANDAPDGASAARCSPSRIWAMFRTGSRTRRGCIWPLRSRSCSSFWRSCRTCCARRLRPMPAMRRAEQRQKTWQNAQKMAAKTVRFKHFHGSMKYFQISVH